MNSFNVKNVLLHVKKMLNMFTKHFAWVWNSAGGAVPALAQLASSSYHAAVSSPSLPPPSPQDAKINKSRTSSTL